MSSVPTAPGSLAAMMAAQSEALSHCVHCGFCLPACPTYVRLGDEADSPRGRLHLMRAVAEERLDPASDAFQEHIDRCLGCRACETVCPSGVEYGFLLEHAREVSRGARAPGLLTRALLGAIARPLPFRLWMLGSRVLRASGLPAVMARFLPDLRLFRSARMGMAMLAASAPSRGMERWGKEEMGRAVGGAAPESGGGTGAEGEHRAGDGGMSQPTGNIETASVEELRPRPAAGTRGRVGVLSGCVQNHLFRRVNEATRRVLEVNGWEVVEVPGEGCCGALHAHAGALDDARAMARRNIAAFRRVGVDRIAANAAGCGAAMRDYGQLLEGDEDARWFAVRVRDVTELLAGSDIEPVRGGEVWLRVAYDPPCHLLHGQRVADPPLRLLRSIPGVEVIPVPGGDECCGGAGIYGITHPDLGGKIGGDKVRAVIGTGADVLATGNPGCAMQIGGGLRIAGNRMAVMHPVEILDESYRRGGLYAGNRREKG